MKEQFKFFVSYIGNRKGKTAQAFGNGIFEMDEDLEYWGAILELKGYIEKEVGMENVIVLFFKCLKRS